ncbi:MAG TPA: hypothetical protein VF551_00355 [Chthoniobacterales bacterium]
MKTVALFVLAAALSSCTTTTTTNTAMTEQERQQKQRDLSEKRTYTREDLARTGESEPGRALQKADPNISVSRP